MNTTDFATAPDCASLPPDFVQRLQQALAQSRVLHLWCPERAPLQAAREATLQVLRPQGVRVRCMAQGQWLPLLQTLNAWIEDSLRGTPLPSAQQTGVWLIDDAQRLSAEHLALIERLLVQFPELPLRLVLLSQVPQPPSRPESAERLAVEWLVAEPPAWMPEADEAPVQSPASRRWLGWVGGAALLALAAAGLWWALGAERARGAAPSADPAVASSAPAAASPASSAAESSPEPSAPAPLASASALPASAAASSAATPASAPAQASSAASTSPAQSAQAAPVKVAAPSPLQAWLQGLPAGSFVVLHGQFASAREAEAFKASDALLANARIAQAVWSEGEGARHGVLTGPFRSADRVSNYTQRLPWRAQARSFSREALLSP